MLSAKQEKCLKLMIEGNLTQKEIASQINVSEKTISSWKRQEEFMQEYDMLMQKSIKSIAAKAFRTQTNLLDSKNDMVKYLVSKDILDRAGYKPDDNININGISQVVFSGEGELSE
jgi:putative ATPase subunit of terminase (gpP-like)